MKRRVELLLLCEDEQQEAFLRRSLERVGWPRHKMRVLPRKPRGAGGHTFVAAQFPKELDAMRRGHVARALVVMIDGDNQGVAGRLARLDDACAAVGVVPRKADERVVVAVPTWNIETWIAYLAGAIVDETRRGYPALDRARECGPHVNTLLEMCKANALRQPSPPSLEAACVEYRTRLALV